MATVTQQASNAVLFELDHVAVNCRGLTFEVLKQSLEDEDLKLTPGIFSRFAGLPSPEFYLAELLAALGVTKRPSDKLVKMIREGLTQRLAGDLKLSPGLVKLIDAARARGMAIGAVSGLAEAEAQAIAGRVGLTELSVTIHAHKAASRDFPGPDAWLKTAKQIGKSPRGCLAVGSSTIACKSALSAGMRCLAVPDAYTAHQDFSGVDALLDDWKDMSPGEILSTVLPALP